VSRRVAISLASDGGGEPGAKTGSASSRSWRGVKDLVRPKAIYSLSWAFAGRQVAECVFAAHTRNNPEEPMEFKSPGLQSE